MAEREILATQPVTARPDVTIEFLKIAETEAKFILLPRPAVTGDNVLAAVFAHCSCSSRGGLMSVHARMAMQNGGFVSDVSGRSSDMNSSTAQHRHVGDLFSMGRQVPRASFGSSDHLETLGLIFTGIGGGAVRIFQPPPKRGPFNSRNWKHGPYQRWSISRTAVCAGPRC